jgi:1-pyrroline-5-carboxylate dehydrogenase
MASASSSEDPNSESGIRARRNGTEIDCGSSLFGLLVLHVQSTTLDTKMVGLATFRVPEIQNEPNVSSKHLGDAQLSKPRQVHYANGSPEQKAVARELEAFRAALPVKIPCWVNGKPVQTKETAQQVNPANFAEVVAEVQQATPELVKEAIAAALEAKVEWEKMPWADR